LSELGPPRSLKEIVVREGLEARCLAHRDAPELAGVRMDEVVPVLREVAGHCRAWTFPCLGLEPVGEAAAAPAQMVRIEGRRELIRTLGRFLVHLGKGRSIGIA